VLRERAGAGAAIFFSSHTLGEVERLCDRVAIVRAGRIVADETIATLRTRAHRVATLFFADAEHARAFTPPTFLRVQLTEGARVRCELEGSGVELMRWAASRHDLADLEVSPPDLERLFQRYYTADHTPNGGDR
jgi:ABC-2 type transport system ATP-binding protein